MSPFTDFRIQAPVNLKYNGPTAPLPAAGIVMFTWTSAEWSAMDHVFLHGSISGESEATTLTHTWLQYSKGASADDGKGGDAKPKQIYSIGTAGGANGTQHLGDAAITNGGTVQLQFKDNTPSGLSGKTFTSAWFPSLSEMPKAQQLFFPLSKIVTEASLEKALAAKAGKHEGSKDLQPFTLSDLINPAIDPANLRAPKAVDFKGTPLNTTDFYYISEGDVTYAALEMDDAVVGYRHENAPEQGYASSAMFSDNGQLNGQSILGLPLMNGYLTIFDRSVDSGLGVIKFAVRR